MKQIIQDFHQILNPENYDMKQGSPEIEKHGIEKQDTVGINEKKASNTWKKLGSQERIVKEYQNSIYQLQKDINNLEKEPANIVVKPKTGIEKSALPEIITNPDPESTPTIIPSTSSKS